VRLKCLQTLLLNKQQLATLESFLAFAGSFHNHIIVTMSLRISLPLVLLLFPLNTVSSLHHNTVSFEARLGRYHVRDLPPISKVDGELAIHHSPTEHPRHGRYRQTLAGHPMVHDIKEGLPYLYTTSRTYARCAQSSESFGVYHGGHKTAPSFQVK
jgi:hypothetical protein